MRRAVAWHPPRQPIPLQLVFFFDGFEKGRDWGLRKAHKGMPVDCVLFFWLGKVLGDLIAWQYTDSV